MFETLWNRNFLHYGQAVSQILSEGSYTLLFSVCTNIFDLSITYSDDGNKGWCFINGLTAKRKIENWKVQENLESSQEDLEAEALLRQTLNRKRK